MFKESDFTKIASPEDDFLASRNIRDRLSSLPDSLKQHRREIEEFLDKKHDEFKRFLQSG